VSGDFTLNEFRRQFAQLHKLGVEDVIRDVPCVSSMIPNRNEPDVGFRRIQGMIDAMTANERRNPERIDHSRRRRIAVGSGCDQEEVTQFLRQFDQMRTTMRQIARMSLWERIRTVMGWGRLPGTE
jgi:signal recognition particle subunit SRP54